MSWLGAVDKMMPRRLFYHPDGLFPGAQLLESFPGPLQLGQGWRLRSTLCCPQSPPGVSEVMWVVFCVVLSAVGSPGHWHHFHVFHFNTGCLQSLPVKQIIHRFWKEERVALSLSEPPAEHSDGESLAYLRSWLLFTSYFGVLSRSSPKESPVLLEQLTPSSPNLC